ncbi:MAG: glycosyltransferase family 2 protein [Lachnospiraceae bacterium]|nr:glycosyltransferase family 2 protein [Lachnospiraceae bacterium]
MAQTTVVIPNYNGIKYIAACLDSLYAGTVRDMEVIVVDNASKDGSLELVKEHYPQVTLIENAENMGFSYAVNQGIQAGRTPYVFLLNNDTEVEADCIEQLENLMQSDERIFSASAKMIALHDKEKLDDAGDYYCALGWAFARGKGKHPSLYQENCDVFAACAGAAIYRREYFDEIGLFDVRHFAYLEDIDIGYRARIYGYRNCYAAGAVVYHAGSATSGSRYNTFKTSLASRNSVYIVYKNMPILQLILNLPFLLVGYGIKAAFFVRKGMGRDYVKGLWQGVKLCLGSEGKSNKVRFCAKRLQNYAKIQVELWINLFKMLF